MQNPYSAALEVEAPGKLVLIGEYAVLEGATALVAAVDRYARVRITPAAPPDFEVESPTFHLPRQRFCIEENGQLRFRNGISSETLQKLSFFSATLQYAWQMLKDRQSALPLVRLSLDTSDFFLPDKQTKIGCGSSAALSVALLKALIQYSNQHLYENLALDELFQLASNAHWKAQKALGSGIDIAASTYGGLLQYQRHSLPAQIQPLSLPPNLHMLFIWSGVSASTRTLLQTVNQFKAALPEQYDKRIDEMREVSSAACTALSTQNISEFLELLHRYYGCMQRLGEQSGAPIISDVHRNIAQIVHSFDAVYKPSGAGSGDIGIAFSEQPEILKAISDQLQQAGFEMVSLNIAY